MTATEDISTGYAQVIANAGLSLWDPNGTYSVTDTGTFLKIMPDGTGVPDRVVVINIVPLTDDVSLPMGRAMMQIAGRGLRNNPLDVDRLLDPIFDLLHGRTNDIFGQTTVIQCMRTSSVPMGQDDNVRYERADKYYLDIAYSPTALRPAAGSW